MSNLVSVTDPLNAITSFTYDAVGRQTLVTAPDPDGAGPLSSPTSGVAYNDRNQVISATNEIGAITSFGYDNIGRRTQITHTDPDGASPQASPIESLPTMTIWGEALRKYGRMARRSCEPDHTRTMPQTTC
jgi:YD repeat-containing protein